jgi:hypothetical protein
MSFTNIVLDTYIAPGASNFKAAQIPDMANHDSQSAHWVANHFLNSVLRGGFIYPFSAYVHNYMRRAEGAFVAHAEARRHSIKFIELSGQAPGVYSRALSSWEMFLTHSWQAEALFAKLIGKATNEIFVPDEGSIEERLYDLYNAMKHAEGRIASGQIPEGALVPVWLTNEGLRSEKSLLTFKETGEILEELAYRAGVLVDPHDAKAKLRTDDRDAPQ